jgi:hypothetical protein
VDLEAALEQFDIAEANLRRLQEGVGDEMRQLRSFLLLLQTDATLIAQ